MRPQQRARTSARLLQVRMVDVVAGRGRSVTLSSVRCPTRGRGRPVEECAHCGDGEGIAQDPLARGEYLSCSSPAAPRTGEVGEGARVSEVMSASTVALRPAVARGVALEALRARRTAVAPVVDGEGRPVGLVAEADLLRARSGARVSDAMVRIALSVPDTAPVSRAAALMAEHLADPLAVVSDDGVIVGMLTAMDVVRWLASRSP